jgi:septum formation protein
MKKIILASGSTDRRELFERLAIPFEILLTNVNEDEYKNKYKDPIELAINLAEIKVTKAKSLLGPKNDYAGAIIIAADTIVEFEGRIIGKAKNKDEAFDILKTLNNKTHNLITGIAIIQINNTKIIRDFDQTKVMFMELSDKEIHNYIDSGEWEGRAGAYSINDKASMLIKEIKGSPSNVVGLPMQKIYQALKNEFNVNLLVL